MPTPRISSGLRNEAASPDDGSDAPNGRPVLIAGPAGKGPTTPQTINSANQAYRLYGTDGPLADDIALALLGAQMGAAQAGSSEVGQVIAVRTETGSPASVDLKSGGSTVMTLRTEASGTQANDWQVTAGTSSIEVYDPENDQNLTFDYDPSGTDSAIRTPSELASAINQATGGRLIAEVERGDVHFEFTLSSNTDLSSNGLAYDSSDARTSLDFSNASGSDIQSLTTNGTTRIGGDTNYFNSNTDDLHNKIIPQDQNDARFYAITAGEATLLPDDEQEVALDYLADATRINTGTESLLNVSTTSGTLDDAAKRDGAVTSEGWERVREAYAGRLDTSDTETQSDSDWAEYDAKVATDADPTGSIGASNTIGSMISTTLADGDNVLIFGQGSDHNGIWKVRTDDGGTTYYLRSTRVVTGSTLSNSGDTIDVANAEGSLGSSGLYRFDAQEGELVGAERIVFDFEADHGIADEDAGSAGTMATNYATWLEGDSNNADRLSVDRLVPEDHNRFEAEYDQPVEVHLASVTSPNDLEKFEGDYEVTWSDGTATIDFDAAEVNSQYDDALVYVSYDSCVFDLYEQDSREDTTQPNEYFVDGQTLVFGQPTSHELVVRPLRVTQYRRDEDLEIRRTSGGNKIIFEGRGNQPGPGGKEIGGIDTVFGFEYAYEPDFPAPGTPQDLTGATSGVNASAQVKARALNQALEEHGKRNHDFIVASGLHVDALRNAKDPVTGETINEPVGVLSVLERHQRNQSETGASPIIYASVQPMEPSTTTGRYTNEQKRDRVEELTDPDGTNAASIISSTSRPETFIFDAPYEASVGGRTIQTSSPALWAGMRSTLPNTAALYKIDLAGTVKATYKYDVAGENQPMPSALSDASINTWDARRNRVQLADERTAAKKVVGPNGQLVETGFKSGVALLAAKEFQQDAVEQLENLLGPVPSGGAEVLRNTVETQLGGIANRTTGVQRLIFNAERNISIRSEGGNALGMDIKVTLEVNGELRSINLSVGAVNAATADNEQGSPIPTAQ